MEDAAAYRNEDPVYLTAHVIILVKITQKV